MFVICSSSQNLSSKIEVDLAEFFHEASHDFFKRIPSKEKVYFAEFDRTPSAKSGQKPSCLLT